MTNDKKRSLKTLKKSRGLSKNLKKNKVFYTHDNGGRPFKVIIRTKSKNDSNIYIYKNNEGTQDKNDLVAVIRPLKIFIGKSPLNAMTRFSGGHGKDFYGNSILLEVGKNDYVYIGERIFRFSTFSKIIKYVSPVGNNDVPYPYAIDSLGNYYLLTEEVVLDSSSSFSIRRYGDPYDYYYSASLITDEQQNRQPIITNFDNISRWYIGDEPYIMSYSINATKNYDRLTEGGKEKMYIVLTNGNRRRLTKVMYKDIIERFGELMMFYPLDITEIIIKRDY